MKNYKLALKSIQEVKKLVKGLTYEEAGRKLAGYNSDGLTTDYDFGNITGTIFNDKGMARIYGDSTYEVIDDDWENAKEPIEYNLLEAEIAKKASEYSVTIGRNEIMSMSYDEMNYCECIDDGD